MTWVEALGWGAGALVMLSGLPNIVRNLRTSGPACPSLLRDLLQLVGNVGWVAYGLLTAARPIAAMCFVNALFMALLILQQQRRSARRVATPVSPALARKV